MGCLSRGIEYLSKREVDLILLDLDLPDSTGFDTFTEVYRNASGIPVVILTSIDDEGSAIRAVQEGAQDYIFKGEISIPLLVRIICYSIERNRILLNLDDRAKRLEASSVLQCLDLLSDKDYNNFKFDSLRGKYGLLHFKTIYNRQDTSCKIRY